MKTIHSSIAVLGAAILLTATACSATARTSIAYDNTGAASSATHSRLTGSGNIVTRNITISDFSQIKASRAVRLTVEDRGGHEAVITADDNVMPYVVVKVEGGTLIVGIDDQLKSLNNVSVTVSVPSDGSISAIHASSASSVTVETTIKSPKLILDASSAAKIFIAKSDVGGCTVDISSAASIEGAIKADKCTIDMSSAANADLALLAVECSVSASSAADATLSGEAGHIEIETTSAAKVSALALNARNVEADASSGSSIKISCSKSIDAEASSGGSVRYDAKGSLATEERHTSSGGSVKKL